MSISRRGVRVLEKGIEWTVVAMSLVADGVHESAKSKPGGRLLQSTRALLDQTGHNFLFHDEWENPWFSAL